MWRITTQKSAISLNSVSICRQSFFVRDGGQWVSAQKRKNVGGIPSSHEKKKSLLGEIFHSRKFHQFIQGVIALSMRRALATHFVTWPLDSLYKKYHTQKMYRYKIYYFFSFLIYIINKCHILFFRFKIYTLYFSSWFVCKLFVHHWQFEGENNLTTKN